MNSKMKCDEKRGVGLFVRRLPLLTAMVSATALVTGCLSSETSDDSVSTVVSDFKVSYTDGTLPDINWGAAVSVKAFRPGQASYEYLDSDEHTGDMKSTCSLCHGTTISTPPQVGSTYDEEDLAHPGDLDAIDITLQSAYTASNFYLKASWNTYGDPSVTYGVYRYVGGEWEKFSSATEPAFLPGGEEPLEDGWIFSAEDRFGAMFMPASKDITTGASFHQAGCFVTCHADIPDMPEWPEDEPETSKYLYSSDPTLMGTAYNSGTETDAGVKDGTYDGFPDMWHWRGARSAPIQTLSDGFVMQTRANDAGSGFYGATDPRAGTGYMYDPVWMANYIDETLPGYDGNKSVNALPLAVFTAGHNNAPSLIVGVNTVAYSADGNFPDGGVLPQRTVDPAAITPDNSRTDVKVYSNWANGVWTLVFERARDSGKNDDHVLNPDTENYSFGFAVHRDHAVHRWHYVTFPVTLGMEGSNADIKAKLNN